MFIEEKIAKSLFNDVKNYFDCVDIMPNVELDGAGVHWNCIVKMDDCEISIYSCDISYHPDEKGRTEEFIVSYLQKGEEVSCGRTSDRDILIKSVEIWLNEKSKEQLYSKFEFVDHDLRYFQKQESEWIVKFPELEQTSRKLENHGSGIVRYEISYDNKSCWSTGFGELGELYFGFTWDGCTIFETEAIREETAEVLKRYLIDEDSPSALNSEFSWIPINILTESYERGKGIEGEFVKSWISMLKFYEDFPDERLLNKKEIILLIQELRNQGYDKTLRAGNSMITLVLSRSRRHMEIENKAYVAFEFVKGKMNITTEKGELFEGESIKSSQKILELLKKLECEDVD